MKIEKVTIEKIFDTQRESKAGKPYTSRGIIVKEYRDESDPEKGRWLSGFKNKYNEDWKEGDVVEIAIEEAVVGDKVYLNYSEPNDDQKLIAELQAKLAEAGVDSTDDVVTVEEGGPEF